MALAVDVVIVGGGVTGLWLLKELRECGWSAIVVTQGDLGGRQTGHSHVYIHRGHLYRRATTGADADRSLEDLMFASQLWDEWLADNEPVYDDTPVPYEQGLFGFRNSERANECAALWSSHHLLSVPADAPPIFEGSAMRSFRSAPARCLTSSWMTRTLVGNHQASIVEVDRDPVFQTVDETVTSVNLRVDDTDVTLECSAVVLTAGSGNQALVGTLPRRRETIATDRSAHMLIVQGPVGVLEPVSGIFELNSEDAVFVVSRIDRERDSVVWLVSDSCRQTNSGDWLEYIDAELGEIFPRIPQIRSKLLWGLYYAPKAELVDADLSSGRSPTLSVKRVLQNVWCVWPIKLTLAPLAALEVEERLRSFLGTPPGTATPQLGGHAPPIAQERWRNLAMRTWWSFRGELDR